MSYLVARRWCVGLEHDHQIAARAVNLVAFPQAGQVYSYVPGERTMWLGGLCSRWSHGSCDSAIFGGATDPLSRSSRTVRAEVFRGPQKGPDAAEGQPLPQARRPSEPLLAERSLEDR